MYSGFLPQPPKQAHQRIRLIRNSKLTRGVNVSVNSCSSEFIIIIVIVVVVVVVRLCFCNPVLFNHMCEIHNILCDQYLWVQLCPVSLTRQYHS